MKKLFCIFFLSCAAECHAASLCGPKEETIFSCHTKSESVSVCAQKNGSYVHYVFGTPRRISLNFPPKEQYQEGSFRGYYAYGPGFQSYLSFTDGPSRYYVYSNYGDNAFSTSGEKMAVAFDESGVVVLNGLNKVANIKCHAQSPRLTEATFKRYRFPADEASKFQEAFFNTWSN